MRRAAFFAVLARPALWRDGLGALRDSRCNEWWKRLLLVPASDYLRWRLITAYGSPEARIPPGDLVRYLRWRGRQRAS